jgi:hypothetical protein
MTRHLVLIAVLALAPLGAAAEETNWVFLPSYYSHSPTTGERVVQYRPEAPAYAPADDTYMESGYRHNESTIQVGRSADRLHVVQTWGMGQAIRPYGEWEYPFRAGATPYGPWGNPQGPWTLPFDSWRNPYGLGQIFNQPWGYAPYGPQPYYGPQAYGQPYGPQPYGPKRFPQGAGSHGHHPGPMPSPAPGPSPAPKPTPGKPGM